MDWIDSLNKAIVYMEENMAGEIDYTHVAKIACCSSFHFQRMFSYVAGVPLAEYIRRRKMSLAAVDLQNGDKKIIDIALKYGYSSPTAFNRVFKSIHGVAPSCAKENGVSLKSYPKISFKLIAKGVDEMEFRIEERDAIRMLGVSVPLSGDVEKAYEEAEQLWVKVILEGGLQDDEGNYLDVGSLCKELNAACNTISPITGQLEFDGFFGIETERNNGGEYMIGVASTLPASGNLKEYILPAHTWAVFLGKNFFADEYSDAESAVKLEERLYSEWLPTSGYEIADGLNVSFMFATEDLTNAPFETWLPVKKAENTQ